MDDTVDLVEAGRLMRRLRESHGWGNRRDFAARIGAKESTIRKYETAGGKRPDREHIERIAYAFGSRDGARLLYAYGLDRVAHKFAATDRAPLVDEIDLTLPDVDTLILRVDRMEDLLGDIAEYLGLSGNRAKPSYVSADIIPIRRLAKTA